MDLDPPTSMSQGPASIAKNGSQPSEDPWEETINLESKFYAEGYQSGFDHGQLHGLYEGRELGQEKAWEIWEEVGYMEGFAAFWAEMLGGSTKSKAEGGGVKGKDARSLNHAKQLLTLIASFPTINPTSSTSPNQVNQTVSETVLERATDPSSNLTIIETPEPDLILLLSAIRSRYKLLCSSIGVRPRLVAAGTNESAGEGQEDLGQGEMEGVVMGIEGPMKGVDTRQLRF